MGQGARRGKVVALLVALALVAVAVPLAEPVWWWVTTKRVPVQVTPNAGGFATVKRRPPGKLHGLTRRWHVESGFVSRETWYEDGRRVRETTWSIHGTVRYQSAWTGTDRETRHEFPWWWGVEGQTHPTAPWWKAEG